MVGYLQGVHAMGNVDRHHIEAIVKIAAENPLGDELVKLAARSRNDPDIDR